MRRLITIAMAVIFIFAAAGCGMPAQREMDDSFISRGEITGLYTSPDDYKGRSYEFTAKVFRIESDADGIYIQAFNDISNYDRNTVVCYKGNDINVKEDDYIRVSGTVSGEFTGKNAFGARVSAPVVIAHTLEIIEAIDAFPADKSFEVDQVLTCGGCTARVSKVDFTSDETRIYLTLQNNGSSELSAYPGQGVVIQDGVQHEAEYNFDYPSVSSQLRPGASSSGIVVFDRLEESDLTFYFDGYGEGYHTIEFRFDIALG